MLLISIVFACANQVPNPSGDCESEDNGSRTCYHSPTNSDTYLLDCESQLNREYWRVFAQSETSAYIIPRPDGLGLIYDLCDDSEIGMLMDTYGLCTETLGASEVAIINDIPPADALRITNELHQHFLFTVDDDGMISPWAPPNDIVDACNFSDENDATVAEFCETALSYYDGGFDCPNIAFYPSPEAAEALVGRLNTLFGLDLPAN